MDSPHLLEGCDSHYKSPSCSNCQSFQCTARSESKLSFYSTEGMIYFPTTKWHFSGHWQALQNYITPTYLGTSSHSFNQLSLEHPLKQCPYTDRSAGLVFGEFCFSVPSYNTLGINCEKKGKEGENISVGWSRELWWWMKACSTIHSLLQTTLLCRPLPERCLPLWSYQQTQALPEELGYKSYHGYFLRGPGYATCSWIMYSLEGQGNKRFCLSRWLLVVGFLNMAFFKSHRNEDLRREIISAQAKEQWAFLTLKLMLKTKNLMQK